jgi:hypothetical protein
MIKLERVTSEKLKLSNDDSEREIVIKVAPFGKMNDVVIPIVYEI